MIIHRLPIEGLGFIITTPWGGLVVIVKPRFNFQFLRPYAFLHPPPWLRWKKP